MSDEHRVSRKEQEKRKGWIGIAVWILAILVACVIVYFAKSIGEPRGTPYYIYFEESVAGLLKNSKVKFRGVEAGRVVSIALSDQPVMRIGGKWVRTSSRLAVPKVEVKIAIDNDQATITENARAELKTNPLSGMQQIDINVAESLRGAELLPVDLADPTKGQACELFAGDVDLDNWIHVQVEASKAGTVSHIDLAPTLGGGTTARVHIILPFDYRNLDLSTLVAWCDSGGGRGRAHLYLEPKDKEGGKGIYPVGAGTEPLQLWVELPVEALAIDPTVESASNSGAGHITLLQQLEATGSSGKAVKFLRAVAVDLPVPKNPDGLPASSYLSVLRRLTVGSRGFKLQVSIAGDRLEPGAALQVARSPLAVLIERADVLVEAIDYLPSIMRNLEGTSANALGITDDFRKGTLGDLHNAITENSALLAGAIGDFKNGLLDKVTALYESIALQVNTLGDTVKEKLDTAFDEETIANLKRVTANAAEASGDLKEAIGAVKETFANAKDIVGTKGNQTLAETVDRLSSALAKVDGILAENATQIGDVMGGLKDTLKTLKDTLQELDELIRDLRRPK